MAAELVKGGGLEGGDGDVNGTGREAGVEELGDTHGQDMTAVPARFAGKVLQLDVEQERTVPAAGTRLPARLGRRGQQFGQPAQQFGQGGQVAESGVAQGEHRGTLWRVAPGPYVGGPYLGVVVQHHGAVGGEPGVDLGAVGPGVQGGEHGTDAVLGARVVTLEPVAPMGDHERPGGGGGAGGRGGDGQRRYASARKP